MRITSWLWSSLAKHDRSSHAGILGRRTAPSSETHQNMFSRAVSLKKHDSRWEPSSLYTCYCFPAGASSMCIFPSDLPSTAGSHSS